MVMRSTMKAALLMVVLGLSGCGTKPTKTFLSIQTSRIETTTFSPEIEAISPLESTSNVAVKPQIDGTVVQILATAGQELKAGQVILVLDNIQQSAALDAARSEARKDILNAERYEYLYEQMPSPRKSGIATQQKPSRPKTTPAPMPPSWATNLYGRRSMG